MLAPSIVTVALSFGAAEYFAAILLALIAASTISGGSVAKGLAMLFGGILIGTIGTDTYTGTIRYSFGQFELMDGVTIALVALGLFAVGEVVMAIAVDREGKKFSFRMRDMYPKVGELRALLMPSLRGSAYGSFFGALPGVGPAVATVAAYATEKNISDKPEEFGTGRVEGVAAPEAANNAAVQTAFIPALSLGIPGSATTAVMLGALIMNGIIPGPKLIVNEPELFWGLVASFWIGNILLLVLNLPLIGVWASVLRVPYKYLFPGIIAVMCAGSTRSTIALSKCFLFWFSGLSDMVGVSCICRSRPFCSALSSAPCSRKPATGVNPCRRRLHAHRKPAHCGQPASPDRVDTRRRGFRLSEAAQNQTG